jgi:hypothetical protein
MRAAAVAGSLFTFWVIVSVTLWLLRLQPHSVISRAAFAWLGPRPVVGQAWAVYQGRWAMYSFGWLCQVAVVASGLWFFAFRSPGVAVQPWFLALGFGLTVGAGMSLVATIAFLIKAAKAHYLGPNPNWSAPLRE